LSLLTYQKINPLLQLISYFVKSFRFSIHWSMYFSRMFPSFISIIFRTWKSCKIY